MDFTVSSSAEIGLVGQETEVTAKARRRQFTAEYKRKVLAEAEACTKPGEIGALLRREGLYSSHLVEWRRARDSGALAGLAPKKRGPAAKVPHPLERRVIELEREVARATRRAERAEGLVELQKNGPGRWPHLLDEKLGCGIRAAGPGGAADCFLAMSSP